MFLLAESFLLRSIVGITSRRFDCDRRARAVGQAAGRWPHFQTGSTQRPLVGMQLVNLL